MKKLLIILLLIPTLALSGTFKDDEGKFGSWIMRVAHNTVIDYFRQNKKVNLISETTYSNENYNIFDFISENEKSPSGPIKIVEDS